MKTNERDLVVLVVDDDDGMRSYIRQCLRPMAGRVIEAVNGQESLALAREAGPALGLVIADVVMPNLDGELLCEALHAEPGFADLPVLLVTGSERRPARSGTPVLRKPFNASVLRAKVREVLESAGGE